jgi:hypothetical protein
VDTPSALLADSSLLEEAHILLARHILVVVHTRLEVARSLAVEDSLVLGMARRVGDRAREKESRNSRLFVVSADVRVGVDMVRVRVGRRRWEAWVGRLRLCRLGERRRGRRICLSFCRLWCPQSLEVALALCVSCW